MLYWMCHKSEQRPTALQLEHAIRRNFGGLEQSDLKPLEIFKKHLPSIRKLDPILDVSQEVSYITW